MSWRRVRGKGIAITKVKVNLKGASRMRHSRTAMSLRGRTTAGLGLLRRFFGSARVGAPAETPAATHRVGALLARLQGCEASGAQALTKLALETALTTVSTVFLALDVRAHCYKAVPLAPILGSGAAPVKAGMGRILRRLQASRRWHFPQLDAGDLLAALLMKPRVQHAGAETPRIRNTKKARTLEEVRADFHESLHSVSLTDFRTAYFAKI